MDESGKTETPEDEKQPEKRPKRDKVFQFSILETMRERYTLLYGTTTVWDAYSRQVLSIQSLQAAYRMYTKAWLDLPDRKMVPADEVKFDPTGETDSEYNIFGGIEMKPKRGKCEKILRLLNHLSNGDPAIIDWILKWVAFPLKNPGSKMRTSIIMHGDQGSGKNLFWEIVQAIYGEYGAIINQDQLETPYNSWASGKLFIIADEVVTRQELRNHKGRLKTYITGTNIQINEKHLPIRMESNFMNLVFLSNEVEPLSLDESDRRWLVVWTPPKQEREFYNEIREELAAGGIEAFYWHLLNRVDLGDFDEHTKPPETEAKLRLIELGLSSPQLFYRAWKSNALPVPYGPASSQDLYNAYRLWCERTGQRFPHSLSHFSREIERNERRAIKRIGSDGKQMTVFLANEQDTRKDQQDERAWITEHVGYFEGALPKMREWGRIPDAL